MKKICRKIEKRKIKKRKGREGKISWKKGQKG